MEHKISKKKKKDLSKQNIKKKKSRFNLEMLMSIIKVIQVNSDTQVVQVKQSLSASKAIQEEDNE